MVVETDIPFVAYAQDCRVVGRLPLTDPRLADLLNRADRLKLYDVTLISLTDGRTVQLDELDIERDELSAVVVDGPRGDPHRRVKTRPDEVDVLVDCFEARGYLHSPPAGDPLGSFERRPPMIALTDASIAFHVGDEPVTEYFETILFNRDHAHSVSRPSALAGR